ncbi:MAG: phospholipase D-like domain-containing protein [Thermofilum sp.]|nr:phospholipase D-like domain-containing protein [Thermofilum sp.]
MEVLLTPRGGKLDRVFARFLLEEARVRGGSLYIVSPWISDVKFERRLIYLPYLDAGGVLEALEQLASAGKSVFVVTRYYDDVLKPDLLYTWAQLFQLLEQGSREELDELRRELKDDVSFSLSRIEALDEILRMEGVRVRFNNRVHAKLYVGERLAIIGSANLTFMSTRNEECVIVASKDGDGDLYRRAREYAEEVYASASEERSYERVYLSRLQRLEKLGLRFSSLESLREWLRELAS